MHFSVPSNVGPQLWTNKLIHCAKVTVVCHTKRTLTTLAVAESKLCEKLHPNLLNFFSPRSRRLQTGKQWYVPAVRASGTLKRKALAVPKPCLCR